MYSVLFSMQYRILFFCIIFIFIINHFLWGNTYVLQQAQQLIVKGKIKSDGKKLKNAVIFVSNQSMDYTNLMVTENGSFDLALDYQDIYKVDISKDGYASKSYLFDTHLHSKSLQSKSFIFKFVVELFPMIKGQDLSLLDYPADKIHYDKVFKEFDYDYEYADSMLVKIDSLQKSQEKLLKKDKSVSLVTNNIFTDDINTQNKNQSDSIETKFKNKTENIIAIKKDNQTEKNTVNNLQDTIQKKTIQTTKQLNKQDKHKNTLNNSKPQTQTKPIQNTSKKTLVLGIVYANGNVMNNYFVSVYTIYGRSISMTSSRKDGYFSIYLLPVGVYVFKITNKNGENRYFELPANYLSASSGAKLEIEWTEISPNYQFKDYTDELANSYKIKKTSNKTISKKKETQPAYSGKVIHYHGHITYYDYPIENAKLTLENNAKIIDSMQTNYTGYYGFELQPEKSYIVEASKYGFYPDSQFVKTNSDLIDIKGTIQLVPKDSVKFFGTVKTGSKMVDSAMVTLRNKNQVIDRKYTNAKGEFFFDLLIDEHYTIVAVKKGYFNKEIQITTYGMPPGEKISKQVTLSPLEKDKFVKIKNIYFDFDKAILRKESFPELDKLIDFLEANNHIAIEITSHADERGSENYNLALTKKRTKAVLDYLIFKGVNSNRLSARAFGERLPIIKNAQTEEEHQQNRRTEFRVIDMDFATQDEQNAGYQNIGNIDKVQYFVQIGKAYKPMPENTFKIIEESINNIVKYIKGNDGIYRYVIGGFSVLDNAIEIQNKIVIAGYDAFVIAFYKNEKISLKKAKSLH